MAKRVQRYRVTSTVMATLTGLVGEIVVNLTNNSAHVHDGVTPGGFELARVDASNMQNATVSQNGRMTTAQVTELTNATANIATNAAGIAANVAALALKIDDISATDNRVLMVAGSGTAIAASVVAGNGTYTTGSKIDAFPTGATGRMMFWSTTTPPGWTINTSLTNHAVCLTTSGGSTGGAVAFTTALVSSGTHSISNPGNHDHGVGTLTPTGGPSATTDIQNSVFNPGTGVPTFNHTHTITGNTASDGGSHTHTHNHNVQYMTIIRGEKA